MNSSFWKITVPISILKYLEIYGWSVNLPFQSAKSDDVQLPISRVHSKSLNTSHKYQKTKSQNPNTEQLQSDLQNSKIPKPKNSEFVKPKNCNSKFG